MGLVGLVGPPSGCEFELDALSGPTAGPTVFAFGTSGAACAPGVWAPWAEAVSSPCWDAPPGPGEGSAVAPLSSPVAPLGSSDAGGGSPKNAWRSTRSTRGLAPPHR